MNAFLASEEIDTQSDVSLHATTIDKWLQRLEHQLNTAIAPAPLPSRPESELVMAWGQQLGEEALHAVDTAMDTFGHLTYTVAYKLQDAILVSLVTGCHIPPCRLNLIHSWLHPAMVETLGCQDKDCRVVDSCRCFGNRLELVTMPNINVEGGVEGGRGTWWFEYDNTCITSHVVHGKNEFRGQGVALDYKLPRGTLTKLLLAHIGEGHKVLTQATGGEVRLFVTSTGIPFAKPSLFTQHWEKLMRRCPIAAAKSIPYFPPVAGRRIFVEGYTSSNGVEPDLWDGAAHVMGTSVRRWGETYNPSRKRRQAQLAVDNHSNYMASMMNSGSLDIEP